MNCSAVSRCFALALAIAAATAAVNADEPTARPAFTTETIAGRVVFAGDAMQRLFNVKLLDDAKERVLVVETPQGQLHPLAEDTRGGAFRLDPRLMGVPVKLLVRRHEGSPLVQVIRLHFVEEGRVVLVDYWCDICSIPMVELKPCDCCQGPIRLRKRPLDAHGDPLPEQQTTDEPQ
ncbi:MAG: hypothetical protein KDA41_16715 [Planctomycetales bacterium]|nr:hypothetical protein [Planctomycetales bacterium]